jgi:hypothetical protein
MLGKSYGGLFVHIVKMALEMWRHGRQRKKWITWIDIMKLKSFLRLDHSPDLQDRELCEPCLIRMSPVLLTAYPSNLRNFSSNTVNAIEISNQADSELLASIHQARLQSV